MRKSRVRIGRDVELPGVVVVADERDVEEARDADAIFGGELQREARPDRRRRG